MMKKPKALMVRSRGWEPLLYSEAWKQYKNIEIEYMESMALESKLRKKYRKEMAAYNGDYRSLIGRILNRLGIHKKVWLVFCLDSVAHSQGRFIVLSRNYPWIILHELAHWIVNVERLNGMGDNLKSIHHGGDYLWVLEMVYAAAFEKKNTY